MEAIGTANGISYCCGVSARAIIVQYNFAERSTVYILAKARKGDLEPIVIKKIIATPSSVRYIDTFNAEWLENELCLESQAVAVAIDYLETERQKILDEIAMCA